jgi:membrane-bound lytic murein transglycosylase F
LRRCHLPAVVALIGLAACARVAPPQQSGELVVAVRESPGFYREDGAASDGFEHDVVEAFAGDLGVKARYVRVGDADDLAARLRRGSVHLAVSLPEDAAAEGIRYTRPLLSAQGVLVCRADAVGFGDPDFLAGETVSVAAGSGIAAALQRSDGTTGRPVVPVAGIGDIDLLSRLAERRLALAATDSLHYRIAANYFPDLRIAGTLPGSVDFAWAFAADGDEALFARANDFIARLRADGTLVRLEDRYFGYLRRLSPPDAAGFLQRMQSVLPHYRHEFLEAQQLTGIDWRLLAALAYQESGWDPQATSPTGVRGIMMLTEDTADALHVGNRLDPRQSILAGAHYLSDLMDQLPRSIRDRDRWWLALAAYNLGMGHMNGARAIATSLKRNPDSWTDMKQVLPLLARPAYYARLKSGRGRGGEAVIMVENIRNYYDIISRFEPPYRAETDMAQSFSLR